MRAPRKPKGIMALLAVLAAEAEVDDMNLDGIPDMLQQHAARASLVGAATTGAETSTTAATTPAAAATTADEEEQEEQEEEEEQKEKVEEVEESVDDMDRDGIPDMLQQRPPPT